MCELEVELNKVLREINQAREEYLLFMKRLEEDYKRNIKAADELPKPYEVCKWMYK